MILSIFLFLFVFSYYGTVSVIFCKKITTVPLPLGAAICKSQRHIFYNLYSTKSLLSINKQVNDDNHI